MQARAAYEETLALERDLGAIEKSALHHLGLVLYEQGDFTRPPGALWEEALALERRLGDTRRVALVLADLGLVAYEQGDYARGAGAAHAKASTIRQVLGREAGHCL